MQRQTDFHPMSSVGFTPSFLNTSGGRPSGSSFLTAPASGTTAAERPAHVEVASARTNPDGSLTVTSETTYVSCGDGSTMVRKGGSCPRTEQRLGYFNTGTSIDARRKQLEESGMMPEQGACDTEDRAFVVNI